MRQDADVTRHSLTGNRNCSPGPNISGLRLGSGGRPVGAWPLTPRPESLIILLEPLKTPSDFSSPAATVRRRKIPRQQALLGECFDIRLSDHEGG